MNNFNNYRYEKKFLVPYSQQYLIPKIISTNGLRFIKQYKSRKVNSIYLDTNNLAFYRENIEGLGVRKKLRLRWYNDLKKGIEIFLEIKKKNNELGFKNIYELDINLKNNNQFQNIEKILKSLMYLNISSNVKFLLSQVKPIILITYQRSYFISNICDCRLTIDNQISYSIINGNKNYIWKDNFRSSEMVIELKYPFDINKNILNKNLNFPFRLSKNSKYVNGINKYYLKKF